MIEKEEDLKLLKDNGWFPAGYDENYGTKWYHPSFYGVKYKNENTCSAVWITRRVVESETLKLKYVEKVAAYDNDRLLRETIGLASGDDYEGCFTKEGTAEFEVLQVELYKRLYDIGFLRPCF